MCGASGRAAASSMVPHRALGEPIRGLFHARAIRWRDLLSQYPLSALAPRPRSSLLAPVHATPEPLRMVRRRVGDGVGGLVLGPVLVLAPWRGASRSAATRRPLPYPVRHALAPYPEGRCVEAGSPRDGEGPRHAAVASLRYLRS